MELTILSIMFVLFCTFLYIGINSKFKIYFAFAGMTLMIIAVTIAATDISIPTGKTYSLTETVSGNVTTDVMNETTSYSTTNEITGSDTLKHFIWLICGLIGLSMIYASVRKE
jgi:hypothetical protein